MFITSIQRYTLPSFTIITSVIPDGKTIRKQYFYQTPRTQPTCITDTDYTGTDSRTKAHSAPRLGLPKCEINTSTSAHRRECEQSTSTIDGQWIKLVRPAVYSAINSLTLVYSTVDSGLTITETMPNRLATWQVLRILPPSDFCATASTFMVTAVPSVAYRWLAIARLSAVSND